ncbi:MAG: LysM peptidoglycan-binding domain-containing protein [Kiritimatiellae bacterium]|nr:LysM peptidoglycan-binding domain-containing protein [Kiritimatiellia bacterium]
MKLAVAPALCITAAGLLTGCATYEGGSRGVTQEREDYLILREDVNRCKDRMATMEIEQQRILDEIQQLRARGHDAAANTRLDELERRVTAMDAARAADRQAVVDQISANVARMMGGGAPKTASSSGAGYEHIVKEGETLSAIAAAYKVKASAIIEANDLKNPNILPKGRKLFIPK